MIYGDGDQEVEPHETRFIFRLRPRNRPVRLQFTTRFGFSASGRALPPDAITAPAPERPASDA